jgi:hypothetical protein
MILIFSRFPNVHMTDLRSLMIVQYSQSETLRVVHSLPKLSGSREWLLLYASGTNHDD